VTSEGFLDFQRVGNLVAVYMQQVDEKWHPAAMCQDIRVPMVGGTQRGGAERIFEEDL